MYKVVIILICILFCKYTSAQLFNNQWIIGQGYYYTADMSEDTIRPFLSYDTTQSINFQILFNSSCISNEFDKLVLFTNGRDIMNDSSRVIEGGAKIMDSMINDIVFYGLQMSQSSIILPRLNNQYYVIYMSQDDAISRAGDQKPNYLYYALVDMNANGGKGKVIRKKIPIISNDTIGDSRMTACRHANGRDWWLVCHGRELDNKINVILVSPDTIYLHHVQKDIMPIYREIFADGQSCFSPDGKHYIACTPFDGTGVYDFDRCTGVFSNTRVLNFERNDSLFLYTPTSIGGCAFSPNSKYFYMNTTRMIAQFCIDSSDIMSTRKFVALYDTSYKNYAPFYTEMLAPNNKIYISNLYGTTNTYHVIHNPDTTAPYCNFRKEDLLLPKSRRAISLPNMPNYQLGPSPVYTLDAGNDTTLCDSMHISLGYVPKYHLPLTGILDEKLHIEWSASSSAITFSDTHVAFPMVSCHQKGNYQIYLSLHDTISTLTCTDRIDTMNISIIDCDTLLPATFFIPTLWNKNDGNYTISALSSNTHFEVYDMIGQLIFKDENYSNNWNTSKVSTGMYLYKLRLKNATEYSGKIFVY
ncbi:MAG: T9SS type A sorting domain-containing protein [Bacteroidota bacterium]